MTVNDELQVQLYTSLKLFKHKIIPPFFLTCFEAVNESLDLSTLLTFLPSQHNQHKLTKVRSIAVLNDTY